MPFFLTATVGAKEANEEARLKEGKEPYDPHASLLR